MAGFCHSKWVILTVQIPKNEYFSTKIVIFQQKTHAKYVKKYDISYASWNADVN